MKKELDKLELDGLTNEWFALSKNIDPSNIVSGIAFITTTLPKFFQKIHSIGYKDGFADCKNEKIENLLKNN